VNIYDPDERRIDSILGGFENVDAAVEKLTEVGKWLY